MSEISQEIVDNFDYIISERGNTYISLRKVKWPPTSEPKLDLRKYGTKSDGNEQIQKGVCFDDDAANELTKVLCEQGYGNTMDICNGISDRDDFLESVCRVLSDDNREVLQGVFPDLEFPEPIIDDGEFVDIRNEMME